MSEKILVNKRLWLNDSTSCDSGAIHYRVSYDSDNEYKYVDATLSIWDCSKKIVLTFDFEDNAQQVLERARKIDKFIHALEEIKSNLGIAYERICNE